MSEGTNECDSDGGLGAAGKAPASEADVPPTVVEILAEWLRQTEAHISRADTELFILTERHFNLTSNAKRLKSILDAKDETK